MQRAPLPPLLSPSQKITHPYLNITCTNNRIHLYIRTNNPHTRAQNKTPSNHGNILSRRINSFIPNEKHHDISQHRHGQAPRALSIQKTTKVANSSSSQQDKRISKYFTGSIDKKTSLARELSIKQRLHPGTAAAAATRIILFLGDLIQSRFIPSAAKRAKIRSIGCSGARESKRIGVIGGADAASSNEARHAEPRRSCNPATMQVRVKVVAREEERDLWEPLLRETITLIPTERFVRRAIIIVVTFCPR